MIFQNGGGGGIRTHGQAKPDNRFRDGPVTTTSVPLQLLTLCIREESNLQPLGPQPSVLSIELRIHGSTFVFYFIINLYANYAILYKKLKNSQL